MVANLPSPETQPRGTRARPPRRAPPRPRPRAAPRSPRPPRLAGLAAHHPRPGPSRAAAGRGARARPGLRSGGPRAALRRTPEAKPAAAARRTCLGPGSEPPRLSGLPPPPLPAQAQSAPPARPAPLPPAAPAPQPPPTKARASLPPPAPAAPNSTDPLPASAPAPSPLPAPPAPGRAPPLPGIWRRRRRVRTRPEARERLTAPRSRLPPPLRQGRQTHGHFRQTQGSVFRLREFPEVSGGPASGPGRGKMALAAVLPALTRVRSVEVVGPQAAAAGAELVLLLRLQPASGVQLLTARGKGRPRRGPSRKVRRFQSPRPLPSPRCPSWSV